MTTFETFLMEIFVENSDMATCNRPSTYLTGWGAKGAQRAAILEEQELAGWVNYLTTLSTDKA